MTQTRAQDIDTNGQSVTTKAASMHADILKSDHLTPIVKEPFLVADINVPSENRYSVGTVMQQLENQIFHFQSQNYDQVYERTPNKKFFVKDLRNTPDSKLNAIHPFEAQIQAVRYVRGILLFAKSSYNIKNQAGLFELIFHLVRGHNESLDDLVAPDVATKFLADQFAELIERELNVSNEQAQWQLVMMRDLGILLEKHTPTCTVTETENIVTVESSQLVTFSAETYANELDDLENKIWFQEACRIAGLNTEEDNWLKLFFEQNKHLIAMYGTPATPSSRWLPLPANVMDEHIVTFNKDDNSLSNSTQFYRVGVMVPYEVRVSSERQRLTTLILKMLVMQLLEKQILAYKEKYGDLVYVDTQPQTKSSSDLERLIESRTSSSSSVSDETQPERFKFYINYQSLLSPHRLEDMMSHKENSAEFINMIKRSMTALQHDKDIRAIGKKNGAYLEFMHTNSAINKHANWATIKKFEKDFVVYEILKIPAMKKWLAHYTENRSSMPSEIANELKLRLRAFHFFRRAVNHQYPYDKMSAFQVNTMLSALELIMMQGPSLTFAGCKSSRDRTSVLLAAVKTMQENPKAMCDWPTLEKGIIHCMEEGHVFRAMSHHSAIVKLKAVRKDYYAKLSPALQASITLLKPFSKKMEKGEYQKPEKKQSKRKALRPA